jgi:hypothetical protein
MDSLVCLLNHIMIVNRLIIIKYSNIFLNSLTIIIHRIIYEKIFNV